MIMLCHCGRKVVHRKAVILLLLWNGVLLLLRGREVRMLWRVLVDG